MNLCSFSWIQSNLKSIKTIDFIQYSYPSMLCLRLDSLDSCFFLIGFLFLINRDIAFICSNLSRFNFAMLFLYFQTINLLVLANVLFNFFICWNYLLTETQLSFSFFIFILPSLSLFIKFNILNLFKFFIFLLQTHCLLFL